jgi:hypothetical protein
MGTRPGWITGALFVAGAGLFAGVAVAGATCVAAGFAGGSSANGSGAGFAAAGFTGSAAWLDWTHNAPTDMTTTAATAKAIKRERRPVGIVHLNLYFLDPWPPPALHRLPGEMALEATQV